MQHALAGGGDAFEIQVAGADDRRILADVDAVAAPDQRVHGAVRQHTPVLREAGVGIRHVQALRVDGEGDRIGDDAAIRIEGEADGLDEADARAFQQDGRADLKLAGGAGKDGAVENGRTIGPLLGVGLAGIEIVMRRGEAGRLVHGVERRIEIDATAEGGVR